MKKQIFRVLMVVGLVVSATSIQGCTDAEVAVTAGVITGAIVAGSLNDDNGHHNSYPTYHPRPQTYCYYDYYGYRRCDYYRPYGRGFTLTTTTTEKDAFVSTDERVATVAAKYDISHYAATYVVRAVVLAQTNDMSGVKDLGLDKKDFKALYEGKDLSQGKLEAVSKKLLLQNVKTAEFMKQMMADIQTEKQKRNL